MVGRALSKYDRPARNGSNFRSKIFCFLDISHSHTNCGHGSILPCCSAGTQWQISGPAKSQSGRAGLPPQLDWAASPIIPLEYSLARWLSSVSYRIIPTWLMMYQIMIIATILIIISSAKRCNNQHRLLSSFFFDTLLTAHLRLDAF